MWRPRAYRAPLAKTGIAALNVMLSINLDDQPYKHPYFQAATFVHLFSGVVQVCIKQVAVPHSTVLTRTRSPGYSHACHLSILPQQHHKGEFHTHRSSVFLGVAVPPEARR